MPSCGTKSRQRIMGSITLYDSASLAWVGVAWEIASSTEGKMGMILSSLVVCSTRRTMLFGLTRESFRQPLRGDIATNNAAQTSAVDLAEVTEIGDHARGSFRGQQCLNAASNASDGSPATSRPSGNNTTQPRTSCSLMAKAPFRLRR